MNKFFILAGGIILLAFIISLLLIFRKRKKNKAIRHYEAIVDKLTLREPSPEVEKVVEEFDSVSSFGFMDIVNSLVVMIIVMVVGITIIGELGSVMDEVSMPSNVTSASMETTASIISFFPVIMVVALAAIILSIVMRAFGGFPETETTYEEAKTGIERYKKERDKLSKKRTSTVDASKQEVI